MSCAFWVEELNASDGRLHKEATLAKVLSLAALGDVNAQVFLGLVNATYNPMVTWGIKQVDDTVGITGAENPWGDFNALLTKLHNRSLTGGAARDAVNSMAARFDSREWNTFCAAVLRKDLRAGISEKTLNKVLADTEWQVPVFSCQLATSCEDRPEMRGRKRLEPKLDGVRVLLVCTASDTGVPSVICYSRNGKVFPNFGHIEQEVSGLVSRIAGLTGINAFVLDGEVVGNTFQELMRQARRKENVQADDSVFHVFDFIPLQEFMDGGWNQPLSSRLCLIERIKPVLEGTASVRLIGHHIVDLDTAAGKDQLERYANDCVVAGYEGIMIKDLAAPYRCKRTTDWLKWKPVITVDLEVVDVEEGTGKNRGRLGALVCSGLDGDRQIQVNVGSGFSDGERTSFWADRTSLIGQTVEILCDVITQNQDGTYSLRFPRFVRFRLDLN